MCCVNNKKIICIIAALCISALLYGCAGNAPAAEPPPTPGPAEAHKIPAEEAKAMLDSGGEILLLDVRTAEEYAEKHIPGAICIPDTELSARREELPADYDAVILVYCRSGRRSAGSAQLLAEFGYRKVFDFGGIIDWPYETISAAESAAPESEETAEHEHVWDDYDCNYQQCEICGRQKRYAEPG